jgi:hypothetical protein
MDYKEVYQQKTDELNEKLQQCKTYNDFKKLEMEMKTLGMGHAFHGKRKGKMAFAFSQTEIYGTTIESVDYLYDDGVSVGHSKVKNLYKVLEVR